MRSRAYLHEYVRIAGANRARYFEHMTAGWRQGARERGQKTFGIWGTLGSTGNWPEVVNLWEYEDWEHLAATFAHETTGSGMQDPFLEKWWREAQPMRHGGHDRLLIPAEYSPDIDTVIGRGIVGYKVFRHDVIATRPGTAPQFLDRVGEDLVPRMAALGLEMVGAYRTAMRDDSEVILIWAIRDFPGWLEAERAWDEDGEFAKWRSSARELATHTSSHLMCSAPLSPTETGKQP